MVKIRVMRIGAKNQPFYRIVVADSRSPRSGKYIEAVGYYNPRTEPSTIHVDEAKVLQWLSKGAQPSESARILLHKTGVMRKWKEMAGKK